MLEHEGTKSVHDLLHGRRKRDVSLLRRMHDEVGDHARDHFRRRTPKPRIDERRQIACLKHTRTQTVVVVVAKVGNAVSNAHDTPFECLRQVLSRVIDDAVLDLKGQIKTRAIALQILDDAQTLLVVREVSDDLRHRCLARMSERRMPDVVTERNRLRQIFVEAKSSRDRAGDLRHFQTVRHARTVVIARDDVNLRLALQTPERLRVQDAVAVALKVRAERARDNRRSPPTLPALRRKGGKHLILQRLTFFPYRHLSASSSCLSSII